MNQCGMRVSCEMADYGAIGKTDWFIQKMRSGWFSRPELVNLAAAEFPDILRKKLDGTIGQYWSDCINPKWSTCKTIQALGLKVVESGGRRHIVINSDPRPGVIGTPAISGSQRKAASVVRNQCSGTRPGAPSKQSDVVVAELWNGKDRALWQKALDRYWTFVSAANFNLEKRMEQLDSTAVEEMSARQWYRFLLSEYFRWKYTAANRYASTTMWLKKYDENGQLDVLQKIKEQIFATDKNDIRQCLVRASSIRGLGIPGASGLLAVLFPEHFGTVDQFLVKALVQIPGLPERNRVAAMNPESLTLDDGVILIEIMRRKAGELNKALSTNEWTPRKVDMVLWTCGR